MAVSFDSASSNSGYPPSGISASHTLGFGSGNNRMVFVAITTVGGTGNSISSCTYDGVSMTLLGQVSQTYYSRESWVRVYYLMDTSLPTTSGSKTVSVSFSGAAYYGIVSAVSYAGAKQTAPPYASGTNFGEPLSGQFTTNRTVVSNAGLLVDFAGIEDSGGSVTALAPGSGQTERSDTDYNEITMAVSDKAYSSSGSNSMAQTPNANYSMYGHFVVEVEESDGGDSGVLGSQGYVTAPGTSVSGSYTCHSGSNRKLLVAAGGEYIGGGLNVDSVTYNGVSLTKIMEADHPTPYNNIAWFYLDEAAFPGTPGAYTLQANFSAAANPGHMMVIELDEAAQGTPSVYNSSNSASSTTISTSITTVEDLSWIVGAAVQGNDQAFTPASGQTELVDQVGGGGGCSACMGFEVVDSAGATSMSWTTSPSTNRLLQAVLAIPPASDAQLYNAIIAGSNF